MKAALFYSIGHSTRSIYELVTLLQENKVKRLVDVRSFPKSWHNPQFNLDTLQRRIIKRGLKFSYLGDRLGGWKKIKPRSTLNAGWKKSFRGYADYMQTKKFRMGLSELIYFAEEGPIAFMCAEAVPWRCHRMLISDALVVNRLRVCHIMGHGNSYIHKLTSFAHVEKDKITYPPSRSGRTMPIQKP